MQSIARVPRWKFRNYFFHTVKDHPNNRVILRARWLDLDIHGMAYN